MSIGAVVMELLDLLFKEKDHISAVDWNRLVESHPGTAIAIAEAHEMTLGEFRSYVQNQWIVRKSIIAKAFLRSESKPEFVPPPPLAKI